MSTVKNTLTSLRERLDKLEANLTSQADFIETREKRLHLMEKNIELYRSSESQKVLLNVGGIIICDNLLFHGHVVTLVNERIQSKNLRQLVQKINVFNEWLAKNENYLTTFHAIGDGMSVSVKL